VDGRNRVVVFCGLWAVAHIAHLLRKGDPTDPIVWIVMGSAVLLLHRPSSPARLAALAAAHAVHLWTVMPFTDNHGYLMGLVNLGLLTAALTWLAGGRRRGEAFRLPDRYVLAILLVCYGAAAVAKLNSGFFEPGSSCAVGMFHDSLRISGMAGHDLFEPFEPALPYVVVCTELLIPTLLLIPATRRSGIVVVVLFHLSLSLSPTATAIDFTIVLFALVFLALPAAGATRAREWMLHACAVLAPLPARARSAAFLLVAAGIALLLAVGIGGWPGNRNWIWLAGTALVVGTGLLRLAIFGPADARERRAAEPAPRWPRLSALPYLAFFGLALANVSAPYLGSKNVGSFTMYSNLRTDRNDCNHFLIPRLPLEMGQDDLVEIIASSDAYLARFAGRDERVTWHELRRHLSADPDAAIVYRRKGQFHSLDHARDDPELVRPHPLAFRLIGHRVHEAVGARCRW